MRLIRSIQNRYGFLRVPDTLDATVFDQGAVFADGIFQDKVHINQFKIFNTGLVCETKTAMVEDCDAFLDDAMQWVRDEIKLNVTEVPGKGRGYLSQMEVQSDVALDSALETFGSFGKQITETLRSYGQSPPDFVVSAINLHADAAKTALPRPMSFGVERRAGQPYESGLYFSSAPLKTGDHLRLLDEWEKLISGLAATASLRPPAQSPSDAPEKAP